MTRSVLAGKGLRKAKRDDLSRVTMGRFYATDFADRLEHEVIPTLKAGSYCAYGPLYLHLGACRCPLVRGFQIRLDSARCYGSALKPDKIPLPAC